jgi:hypothetical protein
MASRVAESPPSEATPCRKTICNRICVNIAERISPVRVEIRWRKEVLSYILSDRNLTMETTKRMIWLCSHGTIYRVPLYPLVKSNNS